MLFHRRIANFKAQPAIKLVRIISALILFAGVHYPLSSSPEKSSFKTEESQSVRYTIVPQHAVSWSTTDLLIWSMSSTDNHLLEKKEEFIKGYSNVICAAANEFSIPPLLLAGVSWREFGGDPQWIDDVAFLIREFDHSTDSFSNSRSITRKASETSFGNVSIQVRRAAATLGYNPESLTKTEKETIIAALKDPVQNIFIVAQHLSDLLKIDFPEKEAADLTAEDLIIAATRFYRGPEFSLEQIEADTRYGDNVSQRFKLLTTLISPEDTVATLQ